MKRAQNVCAFDCPKGKSTASNLLISSASPNGIWIAFVEKWPVRCGAVASSLLCSCWPDALYGVRGHPGGSLSKGGAWEGESQRKALAGSELREGGSAAAIPHAVPPRRLPGGTKLLDALRQDGRQGHTPQGCVTGDVSLANLTEAPARSCKRAGPATQQTSR